MLLEALRRKTYDALIVGRVLSVNTITRKVTVAAPNNVVILATYEEDVTEPEENSIVLVGKTATTSYLVIKKAEGELPSETTVLTV